MKDLLDKYRPLFAPSDPPAAAPPAAAPPAAAPPASAPPAAAPGNQPPAAAPPASSPAGDPPAAGPYRPQGLPETMFGKDDRETMDKMATALTGYRQRDAAVPDKPEVYATFDPDKLITDLNIDKAVAPHLKGLVDDPIMKAVGAYALDQKVPAGTVQGIVAIAYAEAQKQGLLEPPIDAAAERAALLPESAKALPKDKQEAAIEARLKENEDFIKLLMKPGADGKSQLDAKVGENALLMLMDTASGNQFLEFVRGLATNAGRAGPIGGGPASGAGANTREALKARAALPENTQGHPKFDRASWDQLQEDYRRLLGG